MQNSVDSDAVKAAKFRQHAFRSTFIVYLFVCVILSIVFFTSSRTGLWFLYPIIGWGTFIVMQGVTAYAPSKKWPHPLIFFAGISLLCFVIWFRHGARNVGYCWPALVMCSLGMWTWPSACMLASVNKEDSQKRMLRALSSAFFWGWIIVLLLFIFGFSHHGGGLWVLYPVAGILFVCLLSLNRAYSFGANDDGYTAVDNGTGASDGNPPYPGYQAAVPASKKVQAGSPGYGAADATAPAYTPSPYAAAPPSYEETAPKPAQYV